MSHLNVRAGFRMRARGALLAGAALAILGNGGASAAELALRDVPSALSVRKELSPPSAGLLELRFEDLFKMPVGPQGLEPSAALRAADGKRVRLIGFMVHQQPLPHDGFLLASMPVATSDEDEALADDLPPAMIRVAFAALKDAEIPYLPGLLKITGTLRLQPHLDGDSKRISFIQLEPDSGTRRALSRTVATAHALRRSR